MMGYQHVTPRKPKTCDKCGQTINAGDETYKQGSRFYHPTCAWNREKHFENLLNQVTEREQSLSHPKPKVDYVEMMQKYHGSRNDGFLTDAPKTIQLADDDYVRMRYDRKAMRLIPSRPSRIQYSTARKLINQYRKKYAERWG